MERQIAGFRTDEEQHRVALLDFGHCQHMRPFASRPRTQSEAGRESMLWTTLGCLKCNCLELPETVHAYKRTPEFNNASVPRDLLYDNATKVGLGARFT